MEELKGRYEMVDSANRGNSMIIINSTMKFRWAAQALVTVAVFAGYGASVGCKQEQPQQEARQAVEGMCGQISRKCPDGSTGLAPSGSSGDAMGKYGVNHCNLVCPGEPGYPGTTSTVTNTVTSTETVTRVQTNN
jgi:hypothetical protein